MPASLRDTNGRSALDWGVYGVPETYIVDSQGIVVLRFAGPITQRVFGKYNSSCNGIGRIDGHVSQKNTPPNPETTEQPFPETVRE